MADDTAKIKIDTSVDNKGLEKGLRAAEKTVKGFVKGFSDELLGLDSLLQTVAGGPVAVGRKVSEMARAGIAELNDFAEAWRASDEAARKLAHAAESNPYLNGKAVRELQALADELESATGYDGDALLAAETRLASLGRTQGQITKILRTAADLDASGVMSLNEAVEELNNSYNGLVRSSARLAPELKSLAKEELAAGAAVDVLAAKVEGAAARAMDAASGSAKAYEKAVGDLKKAIGGGWEEATAPGRRWLADLINQVSDALTKQERLHKAFQDIETTAGQAFAIDSRKTVEIADRAARAILSIQAELQNGWIDDKKAALDIAAAISELSDLTGATGGQIGAIARDYGDWSGFSPKIKELTDSVIAQKQALDEAAKAESRRAEAIAAGDQAARDALKKRIEEEEELADIRERNQAALEAEIRKIQELAAIEGKGAESAETRRRIMEARVSAYYSLLEEGREYIQTLSAEKGAALSALEAGMRGVRDLEAAEAEAERKRLEAGKAEEERRAGRLRGIDDAIEAQRGLAESMSALADSARADRGKRERVGAIQAELLAERRATDGRLALRLAEIQAEKEFRLKALREDLEARKKLNERALRDIAEDAASTGEEKAARTALINDGAAAAEEAFQRYRVELEERANAEILAAREEASQRIEGLEREKYEKMAGRVGQYAGYVRDAASSIYEIWSNTIQAELDERLDALDKENLSAEERAEAEKKLRRAAADEQHKAAVFQWTLSMAMAAANAAQAVLAALANPGGPAGIALAAVAGALGALQVAAIASAKPKKPSFHSGGVVQGRGEVDATLLGGEVVQTPAQFKTVMDAMANLAAMDAAKAPAVDVVVNNNAAASARVQQPRVDGDKIIFTIEQIVGDAIAGGKADGAFERRDARARGQSLMTY